MTSTLRFSLLLIVFAVTAYYAVLHYRVLRVDHPITQDEPGFIEITQAGNPYTAAGVAACGNVYGPGYAWWARPFTAIIADPYIAHRVASSVALLLTLALLGWELRRFGVGVTESAAGLAIIYILNVSSHSLAASTDLLGVLLYLATITLSRRGTWPALLGGLVFAALATLTKPYFALGWGIVVSHLALFSPPRRALAYVAVSAIFGFIVAGLLRTFAPYYFLSTFFVQATTSARSLSILVSQCADFAILAGGFLLLALLSRPRRRKFSVAFSTPPLTPPIDLWPWAALVSAAALLVSLGWHAGNYLVYFFHLLLGPLALVALSRSREFPRLVPGVLAINLLVLGYLLPAQPGNDNWAALVADVTSVSGPVLAEPLLEPIARRHPNLELTAHGQTASVLQILDDASPAIPAAYAGIHQDLSRNADLLSRRIRTGEFSAIYLSYQEFGTGSVWSYEQRHFLDAVRASYHVVGEVVVYPYATPYWDRMRHGRYPYHVTRWEPRAVRPFEQK